MYKAGFPSSLLLDTETKGRNAGLHQTVQGMERSLQKAQLDSSLPSFPVTCHLNRAVNIEDIFIIKTAEL